MDNGSKGNDVALLQSQLQAVGYAILASEITSGTWGTSTEGAVRHFQAAKALVVDGIVGPHTRNVLSATIQANLRVVNYPTPAVEDSSNQPVTQDAYIGILSTVGGVTNCGVATAWGTALFEAMQATEGGQDILNDNANLAAFTANVLHESGHLTRFEENFNYSESALLSLFKTHFTEKTASKYGRTATHPANQAAIASTAYGNRNGNGDFDSQDGWTYRARGPMQLTFHDNYREFGIASGVSDVLINPDRLLNQDTGAISAVWFWVSKKCSSLAKAGDWEATCRRVNGGTNGLQERTALTLAILAHL